MGRLKEDITSLNKTLIHGNGQPPLITRIAVIEEKIAEVKGKIETMEAETAEEKKLRWEFVLAAVPGILALLTGLQVKIGSLQEGGFSKLHIPSLLDSRKWKVKSWIPKCRCQFSLQPLELAWLGMTL